jgi:hypothetical protein
MNICPFSAILMSLLAVRSPAQTALQPGETTKGDLAVVAQLTRDINAKKLKPGDKISAKVIQDVVLNGRVLVPRNSSLHGHIAEVKALSKDDPRSRVALLFERAEVKGKAPLAIHGVIQAVAPALPDPFLEAIMGSWSSTYAGGQTGHPVTGVGSTGQTNVPTPVITSARGRTGAGALEQREHALDNASAHPLQAGIPAGALSSANHGVFGLPGMFLAGSTPVPAIVSVGKNVELKSGTQIVLRLVGGLPVAANY